MDNDYQQQEDDAIEFNPEDAHEVLHDLDDQDSREEFEEDDNEELMDTQQEGEEYDNDIVFQDDSIQGFFGHNAEPVYCISISHIDPGLVCSGGGDDKAHLWRCDTGEELCTFDGHTDSVVAVGFSFDGSLVATGGMDGRISVWDSSATQKYARVCELEASDEIVWLKWHTRGNIIAAGCADGSVWLWSVQVTQKSSQVMHVMSRHSASCSAGMFVSEGGRQLVTCSEDGSLVLWDPKSGAPIWNRSSQDDGNWHQSAIHSLAVRGDAVVTGDEDGGIRVTHLQTGRTLGTLAGHSASVECLAFSLDPSLPVLASASMDGCVILWDMNRLAIRASMVHGDGVNVVRFHPVNLDVLVSTTTSALKVVTAWNYKTAERIREWKGHQETILAMDLSSVGCVTGGDDGVCLVFN